MKPSLNILTLQMYMREIKDGRERKVKFNLLKIFFSKNYETNKF